MADSDKIIKLGQLAEFKTKADELYSTIAGTVAGVQVNGTDLTPDVNHKVNVTVAESTNNGKIAVNGTDVPVHGLGTAAYEASTAFDASGAAAAVLGASTDGSSAVTVYGARALADTKTTNNPTTTTPKMDGTASVGSEANYAKGDHVHPTDTSRAPIASPTFTGTPAAPTATTGTNTTQIATTAFVQSEISAAISGAASFQGTLSAQSTLESAAYKRGWYWVVSTAGTYAGQACEVGDMVYAIADKASAYSASDFSVVQANLNLTYASDADVDALFA